MADSISIIIPVYNRPTLLVRTLDSVKRQATEAAVQLIIVDNGSTDTTLRVAEKWAEANSSSSFAVQVLLCPEKGATRARNMGFDAAKGEIVVFFDSDDEMLPGTLEAYRRAFRSEEQPDIALSLISVRSLEGTTSTRRLRKGSLAENQLNHCILSTQSYASSRRFLQKIARESGGELWRSDLRIWNDWELGMRIAAASPRAVHTNHRSTLVYSQKESITGERYSARPFELYEASIEAAEKDVSPLPGRERRRLRKYLLYRRAMLAGLFLHESRTLQRRRAGTPDDEAERILAESRRILRRALALLSEPEYRDLSPRRMRLILKFAYAYVGRGLRGCASLISPFL